VLTEGKRPASVFKFCLDNAIDESGFYSFFGSFEALEKYIWQAYAKTVISKLNGDSSYSSFSAREKILSFQFTLAEVLKADRSFVLYQFGRKAVSPAFLKLFRGEFDVDRLEGLLIARHD